MQYWTKTDMRRIQALQMKFYRKVLLWITKANKKLTKRTANNLNRVIGANLSYS